MKTTRPYSMGVRADRVADTRRRVLGAVLALSEEKMTIEITLDDVAARAKVSVQTILRHFTTRDGLLDAAVQAATEDVVEERRTPPGDVGAAVRTIVEHYERRGDFVLRMLGQAFADERIRAVVEPGKSLHRSWVQVTFQPQLDAGPIGDRESLIDLLVVATDVYTWQLLRRDRGLERDDVESRMRRLVRAILPTEEGSST
jgi:AcrR family transcriptional regulator